MKAPSTQRTWEMSWPAVRLRRYCTLGVFVLFCQDVSLISGHVFLLCVLYQDVSLISGHVFRRAKKET